MALQLNLEQTDIGVPVNGAYAKIVSWSGNKDQTQFVVHFYASEEASASSSPVRREAYFVSTEEAPSLEGMYSWLKQQPGYHESEDV